MTVGQPINYAFCPPTSGEHYAAQNRGPIAHNFYPANEEQVPGGWIHNLEHGTVVLLYRGTPSDADQALMRRWFDEAPAGPQSGCAKKVLVGRLDQMDKPFALVAWGRVLLMDQFHLDTALTFAEQWLEHANAPEPMTC